MCHDQVASQQKRINELEEEYSRLMSRMENSLQRQQQMAEELKEMTALNELVLQLEEDNSRLQVRAKRGESPNPCQCPMKSNPVLKNELISPLGTEQVQGNQQGASEA